MSNLIYSRILFEHDSDISSLSKIYQMPKVKKYISISENYWHYISNTDNVYFYKIYENNTLIGAIHLEKQNHTLFMDILVFPDYQRLGFGTKTVKDIQNDIFNLQYNDIQISIDKTNTASIKLFENAEFEYLSQDNELLNCIYRKNK